MPITFERLILATQNEHVFEHDLKQKTLFSTPKIYMAKADLSKRWYVYFSYRNPATGKLQRMKNIYAKANVYKTKEERLSLLSSYRKNLLLLLKQGFNPFADNSELIAQRSKENQQISDDKSTENKQATTPVADLLLENTTIEKETVVKKEKPKPEQKGMPIAEAFEFALQLKKREVNAHTIKDYGYKATNFTKWMKKEHSDVKFIHQISRKNILDFLNHLQLKNSARNRNNFRVELGSLFQVLKN